MTDPTAPPAPPEPTTTPARPDPAPSHRTLPLPALGVILSASWVLLCLTTRTYPQVVGYQGVMPFLVGTNALGAFLLVVVPLTLRQIPEPLQREAMPFLVLAGATAVGAGVVGGNRIGVLLLVNASVLYVLGWLRLRGRAPLHMLVALATPVLFGLGAIACTVLARQPVRRVLGSASAVLWPSWVFVAALLLGVLPVCIPVLGASWLDRRKPSAPVIGAPAEGGSPTVPTPGRNTFAVASLVLAVTGGSLLAVIFGHVARSQIRRSKETGRRLATAGLVLGYAGVVAAVVATLMSDVLVGFLMFVVVR
jgi:hypothetical protein